MTLYADFSQFADYMERGVCPICLSKLEHTHGLTWECPNKCLKYTLRGGECE